MFGKQNQEPSSSTTIDVTPSFRDLSLQAATEFGVAEVRPQDEDPGMLRFLRRTNLEMATPFPENYTESLRDWISNIPRLTIPPLGPFTEGMVKIQDAGVNDTTLVGLLKPPSGDFSVLSVDLEIHNQVSFDGFICAASVSSPTTTLVVDTLFANRDFSKTWMTKMMQGKRVLKVFIGMDNDVFRMRRDWSVFPNGVVDVNAMFLIWKDCNIMDMYQQCVPAVKTRLLSRGKGASVEECKLYLQQLQNPTLQFFIETLFPNETIAKSQVASLADFRRRPIHPELIKHVSMKSFMTLKVFYSLYSRIGHGGLRAAAFETMEKLTCTRNLPRHRFHLQSTPEIQWTLEMILKWRAYLAKNLDYQEEQIMANRHLPALAHSLNGKDNIAVGEVAGLLQTFEVADKFFQSAKLLLAFLDRSGQQITRMRHVICRSCNQIGHVAKFCYMEKDSKLQKEYVNRRENRGEKVRQYQRRRQQYCINRREDPATFTCPWESEPGVPRRM